MSDKNRAGAIVHNAKLAEDKIDQAIDEKHRGRQWQFGGDEPGITPRYESVTDLVAFLAQYGITVRRRTHPKTRENWMQ